MLASLGMGDGAPVKQIVRSLKRGSSAKTFMPDSGQGIKIVYRVEKFELQQVDPAIHGFFFSGDSYVIKYEYDSEYDVPKYIIYFWQGKESTNDEKTASALHALRLDNELSGKAIQIRVSQGEEPAHFLKIFNGKLVILSGGRASGFKNIRDYDSYDVDGTRLFQITGTCENELRAIQVPEIVSSLNSNDVFLLETPRRKYLWIGKGSSLEEKTMGLWVKDRLCPDRNVIMIPEGDEQPEFWESLGGYGPYDNILLDGPEDFEPILYYCYINSLGRLKYEDISPFTQEDLYSDDIMVLDTGAEWYLWIGNDSSDEEKRKSYHLAKSLACRVRGVRDPVIITMAQGQEEPQFTQYFPSWNPDYWEKTDHFERMKNLIEEFKKNTALR